MFLWATPGTEMHTQKLFSFNWRSAASPVPTSSTPQLHEKEMHIPPALKDTEIKEVTKVK